MTFGTESEFKNQRLEANVISLCSHSEFGGLGKFENGLGSSSLKDNVETHRCLHPWKAAADNCYPVLFN